MCSKLGVYILAGGPEGVKYTMWKPWPSVTSLPPLPLVVSGAPVVISVLRTFGINHLFVQLDFKEVCNNSSGRLVE